MHGENNNSLSMFDASGFPALRKLGIVGNPVYSSAMGIHNIPFSNTVACSSLCFPLCN